MACTCIKFPSQLSFAASSPVQPAPLLLNSLFPPLDDKGRDFTDVETESPAISGIRLFLTDAKVGLAAHSGCSLPRVFGSTMSNSCS